MAQDCGNKSDRIRELRYLNERILALLQDEKSRGLNAEPKAMQLVSFCGAGAAIVSAFVIAMLRGFSPNSGALVVFVTALTILLAKATIFALIAIKPRMKFQEEPSALLKARITQDCAAILQDDIELWLSLHKAAVPVHSKQLFYIDRSVWNIGGAVIVALLATVLQMLIAFITDANEPSRECMSNVAMVVGFVVLVLSVKSGWLIEKIDDTWTISKSSSLNLRG